MSTEPRERRSVIDMDRELVQLRRLQKKYWALISRLQAEVRELKKQIKEGEGTR